MRCSVVLSVSTVLCLQLWCDAYTMRYGIVLSVSVVMYAAVVWNDVGWRGKAKADMEGDFLISVLKLNHL